MHKGEVLLAHGVYIYITFYLSRIPYIVHWVVFWGGGVRGIPMYRFECYSRGDYCVRGSGVKMRGLIFDDERIVRCCESFANVNFGIWGCE